MGTSLLRLLFLLSLPTLFVVSPAFADVTYIYDDLGRLIRVIREDGEAATYHYDAVGNILAITRETGVSTTTVVTNVSSASGSRGTTLTLTITGFNFFGASLLMAAPGVTLSNIRIAPDEIIVDVAVSTAAQPGDAFIQLATDLGTVTVPFQVIDPPPTIAITSPAERTTVIEGSRLTLSAEATDNVQVTRVVWSVNGVATAPLTTPPYARLFVVPTGVTALAIEATATDDLGQTSTATRTLTVEKDPGTTVIGRVMDLNGQPFPGATVTVFTKFAAPSQADGTFAIPGVPTISGLISAVAEARVGSTTLRGLSTAVPPLVRGTTDVGNIVIKPVQGSLYYPGPKFAAGDGPGSVVAFDLNRDGIPDLITANSGSDDVSVLLGNGDGTFQASQRFAAGDSPISVAVGDLNGDGFADLVTANAPFFLSGDLSVLLGNADGTFQAPLHFTAGNNPESVVVADLNGDRAFDIVAANVLSDDVSVLLGNGDGTFQTQQRFPAGDFPLSVAVADLNADGTPDIVTANSFSNDISVLLGNGDGTFQPQRRTAAGRFPQAVAVADLNRDDIPDLSVANRFSNSVSVFLGNGDGTFQTQQSFTTDLEPVSIAVADLNRDGISDLVTSNSGSDVVSDDVSILLGNGDGTFRPERRFAVGRTPLSIVVADLNLDGIPDLATANATDDVSILFGNGDGTFQSQQRFIAGDSPQSVAVTDLNSDGKPDIVTANSASDDVSVLLGNGDGTFQIQQRFTVGGSPRSLAIADLNEDGFADLITANSGSDDVSVLLGNGDGTFQASQRFAAGDSPISVAVADLNQDGNADLVTANSNSDNVSMLLGNGDGTFEPERRFTVGGSPQSAAVADLNGDGFLDIVTTNGGFASDDISVLLGNGGGTFQPQQRFAAGRFPAALAVADLNRDGIPDLLTANSFSDDVSILLGNGDGTFQPQQRLPAGKGPKLVAVADLNEDGNPDLVVANSVSSDVSLLLGNGDGTFQPQQRFAAGAQSRSVTVADLNGDGTPDLVTANERSDDVSVLLHR